MGLTRDDGLQISEYAGRFSLMVVPRPDSATRNAAI